MERWFQWTHITQMDHFWKFPLRKEIPKNWSSFFLAPKHTNIIIYLEKKAGCVLPFKCRHVMNADALLSQSTGETKDL